MSPPRVISLPTGDIDLVARVLRTGSAEQSLSDLECDLLRYLAERPNQTVDRSELLTEVWGYHARSNSRAVDKAINRLRKKIERDPANPASLQTIRGSGLRLVLPEQVRSPVPTPVDAFVGRQDERARLREALDSHRIVVLAGPGGYGKTRLACEVARAGWPDAAFISLIGCRTAAEARIRVARGLGADSTGDSLHAVLEGVPLLLLDNAEEVALELGEVVVDWASNCPDLRVLVTSRQTLSCHGERVFRLGPLAEGDALALLDQRVSLDEGVEVRRQLVAALGCVPLAVELGAARLVSLHAATLLQLLPDDLTVLSAPRAGIPDRHASMENNVRWSWSLLTPTGRSALDAWQVFAGPFDLRAATAVLGEPALPAISELVSASLLRKRPGHRWAIESAVRTFARREAGPAEHPSWRRWSAWLTQATDEALRPDQILQRQRSLRVLEPELLQGRTAPEPALRTRANLALSLLWREAGPMGEALEAAEEAVSAGREVGDGALLDRALDAWGLLSQLLQPSAEALATAEKIRRDVSPAHQHAADILFADALRESGEPTEALALTQQAIAAASTQGSRWAGIGHVVASRCLSDLHELDRAWSHIEQAIEQLRTAGSHDMLTVAHEQQTAVAFRRRDYAGAATAAKACLDAARGLNSPRGEGEAGYALSMALRAQGDLDGAHAQQARAIELWRQLGDRTREAGGTMRQGLIAYLKGDLAGAIECGRRAVAMSRPATRVHARCLHQLAALLLVAGDASGAAECAGRAVAIHPDAILRNSTRAIWAAALAEAGRFDHAREELAKVTSPDSDAANALLCDRLRRAHVQLADDPDATVAEAHAALQAAEAPAFDGRPHREHYVSVHLATAALHRLVQARHFPARD